MDLDDAFAWLSRHLPEPGREG